MQPRINHVMLSGYDSWKISQDINPAGKFLLTSGELKAPRTGPLLPYR